MKRIIFILSFMVSVAMLTSITAQQLQKEADLDAEATRKAQAIVSSLIKPAMTDFEKVLLLHEYITDHVKYGKWKGMTSAYTALVQEQADCVGFARGLHRLLVSAGLDSLVVVRKKGHLWVKVKLHGVYYNIDPTWSAVKSRWPQYNWFLLSDAQNVDEEKGLDHVLDSGESYEPSPTEFVFQPRDYTNITWLYSTQKLRIMGMISLPQGIKAPRGGIMGNINRMRFFIPEGQSSVFYVTTLDRTGKNLPVIRITIQKDPQKLFPAVQYYAPGRAVTGQIPAYRFDLQSRDVTGADITLLSTEELKTEGVPPQRPIFVYQDRLAADTRAALYRTWVIDPAVSNITPGLEKNMFENPDPQNVKQVVFSLIRGTQDPFIIAKRIHDWITLNIAYDSDLLIRMKLDEDPQGGVEPMTVLKYRKTNCEGFARLYGLLAEIAGLESRYVVGKIKGGENSSGNLVNHAWNEVSLDGQWYIVDCSADCRYFAHGQTYSRMMEYSSRSDHLFIAPAAKRLAYLAQEPDFQLADPPLSLAEFAGYPRVGITMAKYGILFADDTPLKVKTQSIPKKKGGSDLYDFYETDKNILSMRFTVPEDVFLQSGVSDSQGKNLPDYGYAERQGNQFVCYFPTPSTGEYQGTVLARSLAQPEQVNIVYQFKIIVNQKPVSWSPSIISTYYADLQGVKIDRIWTNVSAGTMILDVAHPQDVRIISFARDSKGGLMSGVVRSEAWARGTRFEYSLPRINGVKLYVSGMPVPDTAGRGNQRMFVLDADQLSTRK